MNAIVKTLTLFNFAGFAAVFNDMFPCAVEIDQPTNLSLTNTSIVPIPEQQHQTKNSTSKYSLDV